MVFLDGHQLKRHAGEMPRHDGEREAAHAHGRVVDDDAVAAGLLEHDEVVEVPVQDARRLQHPQLLQLETHRTRGKPDPVGHADQVLEIDALERDRKAPAQLGQLRRIAVVAGNHREAGKTAFGGLGLQAHGKPCAQSEVEPVEQIHSCHFPVTV